MTTVSTETAQSVLNQLVTSLQCWICKSHPPVNVHICPRCTELFCYQCILQVIETPPRLHRCAKCSEKIFSNTLIKLRCLDTDTDELGADLAKLNLGAGTSSSPGRERAPVASPAPVGLVECHRDESTRIEPGRTEPVPGLPSAVEGSFTVRNFRNCRPAWVCSEHVVDELGFKWRLRIRARDNGARKHLLGAFVELLYGEEGFYEVLIELQNARPVAYLIKNRIGRDDYVGVADFLDKDTLPLGRLDLRFRYTIRPADYKAKVQIQQRLLNHRTSRTQRLKGLTDCLTYRIDNYSHANLQESNVNQYRDQFGSTWEIDVHGNHDFADFELVLIEGLPGIYQLEAELAHPENGCQKRINYERNVLRNQRNFFNFHIRWNQLAEYGYDHGCDAVVVKFTISPLQVDLKQLADVVIQNTADDDDDSDGNNEDNFYYSSSSLD